MASQLTVPEYLQLCQQAHKRNTRKELQQIARNLGISDQGTKMDLCNRIACHNFLLEKQYQFVEDLVQQEEEEVRLDLPLGNFPQVEQLLLLKPLADLQNFLLSLGFGAEDLARAKNKATAVAMMSGISLREILAVLSAYEEYFTARKIAESLGVTPAALASLTGLTLTSVRR